MEAEHERALEEQSNRYQAVIKAIRENPSLTTVILSEEVRPTFKVIGSHDIETGSETTSFEYRKLHYLEEMGAPPRSIFRRRG